MRVHYFQHVPFEGLGSIGDWLQAHGHRVSATRWFAGEQAPDPLDIDALVVMGGPMNVDDHAEYPWLSGEKAFIRRCIDGGMPVLGVCLGAQLIAAGLGAEVTPNPVKEIGWFPVRADTDGGPWAEVLPPSFDAFHWHGDTFALPEGARHLARSEACAQQAFAYGRQVVGLQCHLEVSAAGAKALIENSAEDLVPSGAYVQSAEAMLAQPQRFERANRLMDAVLSHWLAE